jgi:signal transduction histidine kinase
VPRLQISERTQAWALAGVLAASVLLTGLLAVQAHYANAHHRRTAVQVLRDFAGLAGHELGRRAASQLGYEGLMPALAAVESRATRDGLAAPVEPADDRSRRAAALVRGALVADPVGGRIVSDSPLDPGTAAWLQEALRDGPSPRPFRVVNAPDRLRTFVVAATSPGRPWPIVGFELDPERAAPFLAAAVERGALLPPSLGREHVTNARLFVAVHDPGGRERYRTGSGPWPGALDVEVPLGGAYSGALDGWTARVAIDPAAAPLLVIGGLPRSRLPVLLSLLGLSAALVAGALLLVRRERALTHLREEFVASVSHELRTPLTQIRMYGETLLLQRVRSEAERTRALQVVDREARRLGNLVENLLQFSRARRGADLLAAEATSLAPLVRQALDAFRPIAEGGEALVEAELDETARAAVDADALQQMLVNLLDNALKYGPRGQRVTVRLSRRGDRVELSVTDQGPGIPEGDRERVFERFHRLERDRREARAGTGIGLSVVRDLARRQGGRAFAVEAEGGGARVGVELPAVERPA